MYDGGEGGRMGLNRGKLVIFSHLCSHNTKPEGRHGTINTGEGRC